MVHRQKYRGKVLESEVAEAAGENISLEKRPLTKKQVSAAFVGARLLSLNPFRKKCLQKKLSRGQGEGVVEKYITGQMRGVKVGNLPVDRQGEGENTQSRTHDALR
jgi:hypothetical protein